MNDHLTLEEQRKQASDLTQGISSSCIYQAVLREIRRKNLSGTCLDYGAGAGGLLTLLNSTGIFSQLYGADLMARPSKLDPSINWIQQDLNDDLTAMPMQFDVLVSSEVIEHLENPRAVFRDFYSKLKPGGTLIMTTPNQQSIRSLTSLITKGHFDQFRDRDYPRHITALLKMDIERCAVEAGFAFGQFTYTNQGLMPLPKLAVLWQTVTMGLAGGSAFSDNLIYSCVRPNNGNGHYGQPKS